LISEQAKEEFKCLIRNWNIPITTDFVVDDVTFEPRYNISLTIPQMLLYEGGLLLGKEEIAELIPEQVKQSYKSSILKR
jgi:hypothetical protein